jgi:hypothetical protein
VEQVLFAGLGLSRLGGSRFDVGAHDEMIVYHRSFDRIIHLG